MALYREFESKPVRVVASNPVTPQNRDMVANWVRGWGGRVALTPEGYEVPLVLYTDFGEIGVAEGRRVVYDGVSFWAAQADFDERWSPVPGDAEPGDPSLLGEPTG